jgi:hypothetical protein
MPLRPPAIHRAAHQRHNFNFNDLHRISFAERTQETQGFTTLAFDQKPIRQTTSVKINR